MSGVSGLDTQRKRKSSFVAPDSDEEEIGQMSKRVKMDVCERSVHLETSGGLAGDAPAESPSAPQPPPDSGSEALPEHMKVDLRFICPRNVSIFSLLTFVFI